MRAPNSLKFLENPKSERALGKVSPIEKEQHFEAFQAEAERVLPLASPSRGARFSSGTVDTIPDAVLPRGMARRGFPDPRENEFL